MSLIKLASLLAKREVKSVESIQSLPPIKRAMLISRFNCIIFRMPMPGRFLEEERQEEYTSRTRMAGNGVIRI
jgi:hypothetical protein